MANDKLLQGAQIATGAVDMLTDAYKNSLADPSILQGGNDNYLGAVNQYNQNYNPTSLEGVLNAYNNIQSYSIKDPRLSESQNALRGLGNTLKYAGTGATLGTIFGPIGTGIGAGVGALAGGISSAFKSRNEDSDYRKANAQIIAANQLADNTKQHIIDAFLINQQRQAEQNYLNMNALGGSLSTHGADFGEQLEFINAGGTHEQNPNLGVPSGVDSEGTPNLVEQGEVIWNDYVFSNRIPVPENLRNKYKLKEGSTFADAVKKYTEKEERINDPITNNTKKAILGEFQNSQENVRQLIALQEQLALKTALEEQAKQYANGGNLFGEGGDKPYEQWKADRTFAETTTLDDLLEQLRIYQSMNPSDMTKQEKAYMKDLQTSIKNLALDAAQSNLNTLNNITESNLNKDALDIQRSSFTQVPDTKIDTSSNLKVTPIQRSYSNYKHQPASTSRPKTQVPFIDTNSTSKPKIEEAPKSTKKNASSKGNKNTPVKNTLSSEEQAAKNALSNNRLRKLNNIIPSNINSNGTIKITDPSVKSLNTQIKNYIKKQAQNYSRKQNNNYDYRKAALYGTGISALNSLLEKPNYSNAQRIENTANLFQNVNIPVSTIGDYVKPNLVDEKYLINTLNQNNAAAIRAAQNGVGNNRAAYLGTASALARDNQAALSQALMQAQSMNSAEKLNAAKFNTGTNTYNSQANNAAFTNMAQINAQNAAHKAAAIQTGAQLRQNIYDQQEAAKYGNMSNFLNNLGTYGREKINDQMLQSLADNGVLGYAFNSDGSGNFGYVPKKQSLGGKQNKKKRRF